ncbi:MAG: sugar-binding domain-containing protein [Bacteroidota bacterium]
MKKIISFLGFALVTTALFAQDEWRIAGGKIASPWADSVNPAKPLNEYPRPQMVRPNWTNLNGLWQYTIIPKSQEAIPAAYSGKILVPFAVESALSGVGKTVGKDSVLWYQQTISIPSINKKNNVLLHFGAVDWQADIYVNGVHAGMHQGGFDPFTIDITSALKKGTKQNIAIRVWDPTDEGPQPRGKQVKKPEGIWYTPVTGIWQTVWAEQVPKSFIAETKQTPDVDKQLLSISATVKNMLPGDQLKATAWDGDTKIIEKLFNADAKEMLPIANAKLWSPSNPFLYNLTVSLLRNGKVVDEVKSYFAMRKISLAADAQGIQRLMLNNKFVFQYGPLDQGWWPDGLYTPPTEAAMKFDVDQLKAMGFNMIRKHIKVEPASYYYHCDKEGMLLWQDMPSGDLGNHWESRPAIIGRATDKNRSAESEAYYRKEWDAIINSLYNFPCIVVWTPFNEAWGQFKTAEITKWTKERDPSRLVNSASGGNFYPVGDMVDLHNYPDPAMPDPELYGAKRAIVLGEFGGLGLPVEGHNWQNDKNWGYQSFKNSQELLARYSGMMSRMQELIKLGLSAAVYTQTTDVEGEVNGFMTYDRKVIKMPVDSLKALHLPLYKN